jgi:hypothetical protein
MNRKLTAVALLVSATLLAGRAYADCAGSNVQDAKKSYESAKTYESQGKKEQALFAYNAATGYVCEDVNPYEADAAKRAAPLALELGAAAEKRGNFDKAEQLYEAGGQYAAADRAMMQAVRAKQDEVASYQRASSHFRNRDGAFRANNAALLKATGAYTPDPKFIAEVNAMPAKALERVTQKEATAFNEQYLRDYVAFIQARADDTTDAAALQRTISAQQAFVQKWQDQDLVKTSREEIQRLRMWGLNSQDEQYAKTVATKVSQLVEIRATSLRTKFYGAPKLLEDAKSYYHLLGSENSKLDGQLAAIRSQAAKLGDEANGKKRYTLAAEYYEAAGDEVKAQAVRDRQQQLAMQKMQPAIDQARKQAEAIQKQYSDPAKVEEMKKQAEAARKAIQADQASSKAKNKKSAEDLEKELGL